MNNSIDRRAAIDALEEYLEEYDGLDEYGLHSEKWCAMSEAKMAIEALPSAQLTLHGYNIEHLELIARILQKEDLPPERVVEALTDISRIVAIVRDEFEETLRRAVDQISRQGAIDALGIL